MLDTSQKSLCLVLVLISMFAYLELLHGHGSSGPAGVLTEAEFANTAAPGSTSPFLSESKNGAFVLSWLEPTSDHKLALRVPACGINEWSAAQNRHCQRIHQSPPRRSALGSPPGQWFGKLTADVTGEVEAEEAVLVIRRIHVAMHLVASAEARETIERVHGLYPMHCPLYRTLYKAIQLTSSVDLV